MNMHIERIKNGQRRGGDPEFLALAMHSNCIIYYDI